MRNDGTSRNTRGTLFGPASIVVGLVLPYLAGCQVVADYPGTTAITHETPTFEAVTDKAVRYEIRSDLSDIRFLVFSAGPLAKLGHNHVVQAKNIRGEIRLAPDVHQSSFSIQIPVTDFQVDADSARQDEGAAFSSRPDAESIAGTTRNMLGEKVLDVVRYPTIDINSTELRGPEWGMDIGVRIKLHGVERDLVVPVTVAHEGDAIVTTAFFSITQTEFGITPMALFGGALQVNNIVRVRMRIVATTQKPRSD